MVTAIVLAGGEGDPLAQQAGVASKALLPFDGAPLVVRVLRVLAQCPAIGQVLYVGEADDALTPYIQRLVPAGVTLLDSLQAGAACAEGDTLLALAADLPWLEPAAIHALLAAADNAAITYPVVRKEVMEAVFPQQTRTYAKLQDGAVTGGNAFVVKTAALSTVLPFANRAYRHRKNPLFLAQLVGVPSMLRYAMGRLTLTALEARVADLLNLSVHAYVSEHACLAADVDKPSHMPIGNNPVDQRQTT
jgi:molybdopterin-guanine dinucleotide biosynthesis protein A